MIAVLMSHKNSPKLRRVGINPAQSQLQLLGGHPRIDQNTAAGGRYVHTIAAAGRKQRGKTRHSIAPHQNHSAFIKKKGRLRPLYSIKQK